MGLLLMYKDAVLPAGGKSPSEHSVISGCPEQAISAPQSTDRIANHGGKATFAFLPFKMLLSEDIPPLLGQQSCCNLTMEEETW